LCPSDPGRTLQLGVPLTYVLDGLEAEAAPRLPIADLPLSELAGLSAINAGGGFAPIEAYAWHKPLLERRGGEYDPRVRARIERASGMTAVEYIKLGAARADLIMLVAARTSSFDALLMPTVAITAPPIAAFEQDEEYRRLNALLLRNTSVVNFLDCCVITVPVETAGPLVGLMIVGGTAQTVISSELRVASRRRSTDQALADSPGRSATDFLWARTSKRLLAFQFPAPGSLTRWRVDAVAVLPRAGKDGKPERVALGDGQTAGQGGPGKRDQYLNRRRFPYPRRGVIGPRH
jgi:hypothetical protein